jgi:DNA-binding XRE family transcriptional regulator
MMAAAMMIVLIFGFTNGPCSSWATRETSHAVWYSKKSFASYGVTPRGCRAENTVQCAVASKLEIASQLRRFGANVRRARGEAGLTQERLAEKADLNIRTLQSIEAGDLNVLVTTAMRLQKALGCRWESLFRP